MPQMPCKILAVRIEPFDEVKVPQSGIEAGIPGLALDLHAKSYRGKSEAGCIRRVEFIDAQWIKRPICRAVWECK